MERIYEQFITVSHSMKSDLVESLNKHQSSIWVIPNSIDLERFRPRHKNPEQAALWAGNTKKYKRLDHLLKTFKNVEEEIPGQSLYPNRLRG